MVVTSPEWARIENNHNIFKSLDMLALSDIEKYVLYELRTSEAPWAKPPSITEASRSEGEWHKLKTLFAVFIEVQQLDLSSREKFVVYTSRANMLYELPLLFPGHAHLRALNSEIDSLELSETQQVFGIALIAGVGGVAFSVIVTCFSEILNFFVK